MLWLGMARKRHPRHNLTIIMEAKEEDGILIGLQQIFNGLERKYTSQEVGLDNKEAPVRYKVQANLINFEEAKSCMAQMET